MRRKDFQLFAGKNAERLLETSGASDQLAKSLNDVADNFSLALTQSTLFRDNLSVLNEMFKTIAGYDPITVRIRLQEGESPRKIAEDANSGFWNGVWRGTKAAISGIPPAVLGYDVLTGNSNAWQNFQGAVQPGMIKDRDVAYTESELTKVKSGLDRQKQSADIQRAQTSTDTYMAWQNQQAEAFRKASEKQGKIDDKAVKDYERKREQKTEKLKRELEKRQQLLDNFSNFRSSAAIDLTDNPFDRLRLQGIQNANESYKQFLPLGKSYVNQAAELERQKAAKQFQEELKNQIENVCSLASGASNNPFVQLFDNARTSMDKARESTKWLTKDIQKMVSEATRANNAESLFNLRVDTALDALSLRQKANTILDPDRNFSLADSTRDQYYAIQNTNVDAGTKSRRSAEIFSGANPRDFPKKLLLLL